MREVTTCSYLLVFASAKLCDLPEFALTGRQPQQIVCYLEEEQEEQQQEKEEEQQQQQQQQQQLHRRRTLPPGVRDGACYHQD